MTKSLWSAVLGLGLAASLLAPTPTLAARNIITQRNNTPQPQVVSPGDADVQELLQLLEIELQPTDPIWYDQNFIDLVNKYRELRSDSLDMIQALGELALKVFDIADIGAKIDDERFQELFSMSEQEAMEMAELRAYIKENLEAFKADPEGFLAELMSTLENGTFDEYDHYYDEQAPYAYGYSDPYDAVPAGRVVWLYDDSYNPLDSDMAITWTQTYGPEVTWLNTDSERNAAFIMPDLAGTEYSYLAFDLTADNGYSSSTYTVYVYGMTPYKGDVADAYREIMGREISEFDYNYWQELWWQGRSIEEIRKHFELTKEYEELWVEPMYPDEAMG